MATADEHPGELIVSSGRALFLREHAVQQGSSVISCSVSINITKYVAIS